MSDSTLFDPGPPIEPGYGDDLSPTRRLTIRNNQILVSGRHPATLLALAGNGETCGTCAHHEAVTHYTTRERVWHKCELHRLGQSHSAASDIRVSWPACVEWVVR